MEQSYKEDSINLKKEFLKYYNFKYYFIISIIVTCSIAFLYLRYANPIYSTEGKIKLLDDSKSGKISMDIYSVFQKSDINIENEIEIIKSKRLIEEVVKNLNLTTSYILQGGIRNKEIWNPEITVKGQHKNNRWTQIPVLKLSKKGFYYFIELESKAYKINQFPFVIQKKDYQITFEANLTPMERLIENEEYYVYLNNLNYIVESTSASISVEKVGKESEILNLRVTQSNKHKSEAIVNELIAVYNQDGIEDRRLVNQRTVEFIDERFKTIYRQLDSIENNKKQFKGNKSISFLENDAANDLNQRSVSEKSLYEIETQIALSDMLLEALKAKKAAILPSNLGIDNAIINQKIEELNKKIITRDRLARNAGLENEVLKQVLEEINTSLEEIKLTISTYKKQLNIALSQSKENYYKNSSRVAKVPENEKILRGIERQQKIKEDLFLLLLQKREEAAIAYAVTAPSIKVVEKANSSIFPISPKKYLIYTLALILGFGIPFAIIYLNDILNTKIRGVNDIINLNNKVPLIGEIPLFENNKLFTAKNDRSVFAEAFRTLSSNVNFALPLKNEGLGQIIMVTSTIKGEGKTYISSNLALALFNYNKKVLLIGADMRNPKIHTLFNLEKQNEGGLSKYLYDINASWKDNLTNINGLDVLFSGLTSPNPSNLLSNGRFETLIEEAKKEYDYIVVDSCPTLYINDSFLIGHLADLTLYVTRFNFTERELLDYPLQYQENQKLKNINLVFNGIDLSSRYSYYNYNYRYSYYYGGTVHKKSKLEKIVNKILKFFKK